MAVFAPKAHHSLWQPHSEPAKASLPSFIPEPLRKGKGYFSIFHYLRIIAFRIYFFLKPSLLKSKNIQAVNYEKLEILKLRNLKH